MSTSAESTIFAKRTSYAVTTTSFRPSRFIRRMSRIVTFFTASRASVIRSASELCQRSQPEIPVRERRMRNYQRFVLVVSASDHHDVEIYCSGFPLHGPDPAAAALDVVQRGKQCTRFERRRHCNHLIQI